MEKGKIHHSPPHISSLVSRMQFAERRVAWKLEEWGYTEDDIPRKFAYPLSQVAQAPLFYAGCVLTGIQADLDLLSLIHHSGAGIELSFDDPQDLDMEQQALEIEPIVVTDIKDNSYIKPHQWDPALVSFAQQENKVYVYWNNQDIRKYVGILHQGYFGGEWKTFIFTPGKHPEAAYGCFDNFYTVSCKYLQKHWQTPYQIFPMLLHETVHARHMQLQELRQKNLHNLFLYDNDLRDAFLRFAMALYSDPYKVGSKTSGELYLKAHLARKINDGHCSFTSGWRGGMKDTRSIVFQLNGKEIEVFLGELIAEFFAYMSDFQLGKGVFYERYAGGVIKRNGPVPRYNAMLLAYKRLCANPLLKKKFDSYGLFKDNTPAFYRDFMQVASMMCTL